MIASANPNMALQNNLGKQGLHCVAKDSNHLILVCLQSKGGKRVLKA